MARMEQIRKYFTKVISYGVFLQVNFKEKPTFRIGVYQFINSLCCTYTVYCKPFYSKEPRIDSQPHILKRRDL
jgi:hypothetical protein